MDSRINKKLSAAIADPILRAHKQGGFALAFLVLGAMMIFATTQLDKTNPIYWVLAILGALLVLAVVALFYYRTIRPLKSASSNIEANAAMVDSIQLTAIQLTEIASLFQATAFKHADALKALLIDIATYARSLPVVGPAVSSYVEKLAEKYAPSVVGLTEDSKKAIDGLKQALVDADAEKVTQYAAELAKVRMALAAALADKRRDPAKP